MSCIVPRTCTTVPTDDARQRKEARSRPLADFRPAQAYVLLGDPGSGKSTSFEAECDALRDEACLVTARDFLALNLDAHPEWHGRTLFIDGLDEVRAGRGDARTPFDALRRRLDALGRPRFRLSCREADWLGANDRINLAKVSPAADLTVLRLDPLAEDDIERILNGRSGIDAVRSFMATAKEKGVAGLLANPQCLTMLADVVTSDGGWPASRLDLFQRACRLLVSEHNQEHMAATEGSPLSAVTPDDDLLDAAGRLCAVFLISGTAGYATVPDREDADHPDLGRCGGEYREQCRQAVSTKLFKAAAEGRCWPVHRHVAEFLAGRYLARRIDGEGRNGRGGRHGIPARRVVALMTGHDGEVVTVLRGLSAWVAACSPDVRKELIERDAIGVTLYGDASNFSAGEKAELLTSLAAESGELVEHLREAALNPTRSISAAGSLVAPETEKALRGILLDPSREDGQQTFVLFVLHALQHGASLPGLTDALLQVVRDDDRWPGVQRRALDALLHGRRGDEEFIASLKGLLKEVHAGDISDPDDYLLGALLTALYPGYLSPSDVWLHLTDSASDSFGGWYYSFWVSHLVDDCPEVELAEHLDVLVARQQELGPALKSRSLQDVPGALLARGLEEVNGIETQREYDWLGLALRADPRGDAIARVRTWLTQHPDTQKAILLEGLERASKLDDDEFWRCSGESERRCYQADLPPDFGSWCMGQATAWVDRDRRVAEYFLQRARRSAHGDTGARSSLDILERRAREHVVLNATWRAISDAEAKHRQEMERLEREHRRYGDEEEQRHREWLDWVRSNAAALRENRCEPALLHQLATAYFGYLVGAEGADPRARLRRIFRNDGDLEDAALCGLRDAIHRDDLPDTAEIVRLRDENREHFLGWPVLASLSEICAAEPGKLDELSRNQVQTALAFYFCARRGDEPPWYRWAIRSCPRVVSDVLVRVAKSPLRRGEEGVNGVREVANRVDHIEVARYAVLPLLGAAAVRGKVGNRDLNGLLWAALRYSEREPLLILIEQKLSRTSMNVAQRVSWLAAGLVAAPEDYIDPLERYVDNDESRAECVSKFLDAGAARPTRVEEWKGETFFGRASDESHRVSVASFWAEQLEAGVLHRLVRLTGRADSSHASFSYLIQALSVLPDVEAGEALQALVSEPTVSRWRDETMQARDDQRVVRRDAVYRHPDVDQICRTLDDGPPANSADLAALVTDRLGELGQRIRNGNTDDWGLYWNEDRHGRPREPKHEESCRDALLSDLQQCLRGDADAQPEGHYANDKRADIRISCRDFQIPVEIKKNSHPKLWSALQDQLIARYTRDPETDGYGIYLVLWFGEVDGHRNPPPPSGVYPDSPEALKARLEDALTPEEARKISVCVIDVSAPSAKPK